ncbi:MAG: hypothetical protein II998_08880 [Clostridia bacterium]|nr:hypothetical protein [Clostridia bacterium]
MKRIFSLILILSLTLSCLFVPTVNAVNDDVTDQPEYATWLTPNVQFDGKLNNSDDSDWFVYTNTSGKGEYIEVYYSNKIGGDSYFYFVKNHWDNWRLHLNTPKLSAGETKSDRIFLKPNECIYIEVYTNSYSYKTGDNNYSLLVKSPNSSVGTAYSFSVTGVNGKSGMQTIDKEMKTGDLFTFTAVTSTDVSQISILADLFDGVSKHEISYNYLTNEYKMTHSDSYTSAGYRRTWTVQFKIFDAGERTFTLKVNGQETLKDNVTVTPYTNYSTPGSNTHKIGDVINYAQPTDIIAKINGFHIQSYNVDGYTYVCVEDLNYYGFYVNFDWNLKTLSVVRKSYNYDYYPNFLPSNSISNYWSIGPLTYSVPILYTDIVTYLDGERVESANIGGKTIINFHDLAKFGSVTYDNNTRTISLQIDDFPNYTPDNNQSNYSATDYRVGDYITFGKYEQDNIFDNGKENLEWKIVDIKDGKALLVSKYGLECKPYNNKRSIVTWESCSLRQWLNNEFFINAFNGSEQAMILTTNVVNADNASLGTEGGNDTLDKVFLLSSGEVEKYFGSESDRLCMPTSYASNTGVYANGDGICWWWLRSTGGTHYHAVGVDIGGVIYSYGYEVYDAGRDAHSYLAVRPAVWIKI